MSASTLPNAADDDILVAQRIISAASRHDLAALKILLKHGSANVRDSESRTTPLHSAIASCEGNTDSEEVALPVVTTLLENGAIWNDLDKADETPGCIALRLGLKKVYDTMVAAGVRAELLFNRLHELDSDDEEAAPPAPEDVSDDVSKDNHAYLGSQLRYKPGILLDSSDNAVMMDWETDIMKRHAETLLPRPGLRAMNVGHGMGIVDGAIQTRGPAEHHIVEAHPQVLRRLRENGWYDKPGVVIHEGRWQDVLPRLAAEGVVLDAIYYDTFAEDYAALKDFFSEHVIQLLDSEGLFGWYNGLGADRQICYDVYTQVAEMDLNEAGFDTLWEDIPVPADLRGSEKWKGTRRPYWAIDVYRLPVNSFVK
jgi:protein arginine N-methyltransferase 2